MCFGITAIWRSFTCGRVALFCTILRKHMAGIMTACNCGKYTFVNRSSMLISHYYFPGEEENNKFPSQKEEKSNALCIKIFYLVTLCKSVSCDHQAMQGVSGKKIISRHEEQVPYWSYCSTITIFISISSPLLSRAVQL